MVCNAAVNPHYGPMATLPDEAFGKVMDSNVRSNWWLCNLALPDMAARKDGSVIIVSSIAVSSIAVSSIAVSSIAVSSIAGLKGSLNLGVYAISKAADFQLARNLAVEWGPSNIRVNCIAPGIVRTDFARALWENPTILTRAEEATPLRRVGEPDDIAGAAVFLASRAGSWITGHVLVIDGGVTIAGVYRIQENDFHAKPQSRKERKRRKCFLKSVSRLFFSLCLASLRLCVIFLFLKSYRRTSGVAIVDPESIYFGGAVPPV